MRVPGPASTPYALKLFNAPTNCNPSNSFRTADRNAECQTTSMQRTGCGWKLDRRHEHQTSDTDSEYFNPGSMPIARMFSKCWSIASVHLCTFREPSLRVRDLIASRIGYVRSFSHRYRAYIGLGQPQTVLFHGMALRPDDLVDGPDVVQCTYLLQLPVGVLPYADSRGSCTLLSF